MLTYDAKWQTIDANEIGKINKREGQIWFALREVLLNPKYSSHYEITQHRLTELSKVYCIITDAD